MKARRLCPPRPAGALAVLLSSAGIGCGAVRPEPTALPELAAVDAQAAAAPAADLPVVELEHDGVRGGQITAAMAAAPEDVLAMLLDFSAADGHRAWARHYELVERDGTRTVARWAFAGKLGVEPTAELAFVARTLDGEIAVEYEQIEPVFGLGAFFGDYRIRPMAAPPAPEPASGSASDAWSLLVMRVYIDSGLPFVNASADDIAAGLREDVRLMREWLRERRPASSPFPPTAPVDGDRNGP